MFRALSVCALVLVLPLVGRADDKPEPTETVIQVTVQPAPAPKPALRYQLLPELQEMNPGNAAQAYLLCFMEQNNFFYRKDAVENRDKWQTMPLKDLPLKELRDFGYGKGSGPLRQADYAARLDRVDWQILLKEKKEGIKLLIPEVQSMRILGGALKVRFRVEVVERRFEDALVTAKTLFALARHLEEHPTLISDLVGIAIAFLAIGPLDEMIQQPGCPNLFWALTDLPKPLISTHLGCQGERIFLSDVFALLDDLRSHERSAAEGDGGAYPGSLDRCPRSRREEKRGRMAWRTAQGRKVRRRGAQAVDRVRSAGRARQTIPTPPGAIVG